MEDQVVNAIEIAWNPTSDQNLKAQAFDYINSVRNDPSSWQACLNLFTRENPRPSEIVRHVTLEIINNAVQSGLLAAQGDAGANGGLVYVKDSLMNYVKATYGRGGDSGDSPVIQNKLAQTLTCLFTGLYGNGWESCFDELLALTYTNGVGAGGPRDNAPGIVFYLRVANSIHTEIGDQMIITSGGDQEKANNLKDLVRERDMQKIAQSWQEILTQWHGRNDTIIELCLKAVGSWVSWIDISLIVNQSMLDSLFAQLAKAQQASLTNSEEKVRDAAIDVFTEIVGKKMKPTDKIDMISFLNLENVVAQLIACPMLSEQRFTSRYDTDLAETVAKLVNTTVADIVKVLDTDSAEAQTRQNAESKLQAFLPLLLRFFSDEYDEVCSTVIGSMTDVLTYCRKVAKSNPQLAQQQGPMLLPILKAIINKMRYDETSGSSWDDDGDQTDEAEFQELRKRLNNLQQIVAAANDQLYMEAMSEVVGGTFESLKQNGTQMNWRDLELALHEMYLFGDMAVRTGGLYLKNKPNSPAAERLIEMLRRMVESDINSYSHPTTQLEYMEICVRYSSFFEHHLEYIPPVLSNFLQLVHHQAKRVRIRSWYLFFRFTKHLRAHVGNVAEQVIQALNDLLYIHAELPQDSDDGDDMSSEDHEKSADALFSSQMYLFEAIGSICSTSSVPVDKQVLYIQSVMTPIFADMETSIAAGKAGDERAILQVHHDIMALGTLARGFSDWMPGTNVSGQPPAAEVAEAFARVSEATLVALESLKSSFSVRTAARFAFSRLIGVLGARILPQLPQWIEGLLTQSSSKDELALFLRLLEQVIFGFKTEIYGILDTLLSPFLQRVFAGISDPAQGTDDEVQLAELKREYLNFLIVMLNNDLSSVIVSQANQSIFETIISTIEHFTKDPDDYPTAKMAFQVLTRMCISWGGPDHPPNATPQPTLPGFDSFMVARFLPLCFALPGNPSFNPRDAQAKQVLGEAANLQREIYRKTGGLYAEWLRGMGMSEDVVSEWLGKAENGDAKVFRKYFQDFVIRMKSS